MICPKLLINQGAERELKTTVSRCPVFQDPETGARRISVTLLTSNSHNFFLKTQKKKKKLFWMKLQGKREGGKGKEEKGTGEEKE